MIRYQNAQLGEDLLWKHELQALESRIRCMVTREGLRTALRELGHDLTEGVKLVADKPEANFFSA